jgi:hypothetical protein
VLLFLSISLAHPVLLAATRRVGQPLPTGLPRTLTYHDRAGQKFYIITEYDRSLTTVLLPEDY